MAAEISIWKDGEADNINLENGNIKLVTINSLIIVFTRSNYTHHEGVNALLFGHKSIISSTTLLEKLLERFNVPPEANLKSGEIKTIQLQVINILIQWLNLYFCDFSGALLEALQKFINNISGKSFCEPLSKALSYALQQQSRLASEVKKIPRTFLPCNTPFDEIPSMAIAKQITFSDYEIYSAIKAREFTGMEWTKADKFVKAPNITAFVHRFNLLACWVPNTILKEEDMKDRARIYEKFIDIAACLFELRNFNSLKAIISGLNTVSVHRLKKTRELLSKDKFNTLKELENVVNSSRAIAYKELRVHQAAPPPLIVFLGVILTDLVFIEEGNPSMKEGYFNFYKLKLLFKHLEPILASINTPYNITRDPHIQSLMHNLSITSDDEQYKLSLAREPRG